MDRLRFCSAELLGDGEYWGPENWEDEEMTEEVGGDDRLESVESTETDVDIGIVLYEVEGLILSCGIVGLSSSISDSGASGASTHS